MKHHIKELRTSIGWTQEQFSERLGVSRQTIISIENGRYNPSLELAFRISKLFGKTIEEVFIFEEGMYYDQNGMECVVSVMDNMLIDSVAIYVDDVQTTYTEDGEMYTFLIPESNRRQSVKVVAKDKAILYRTRCSNGRCRTGTAFG